MVKVKAKAKAKTKTPMSRVLSSINQKTERVEPEVFNKIGGFVITKLLSYRKDLALICNEINKYGSISNEATYEFYLKVVPKNKKFAKKAVWDKHPDLDLIIEYYNCNTKVAQEYLRVLSPNDIEFIRKKCFKGGVI